MTTSQFLSHGFRFVEYDNATDLNKIAQLEGERSYLGFPRVEASPDLRFRKLGKHKATGLYSPYHNTLCVDIRNVNSFVHEYAHLIDFKRHTHTLSMHKDFASIVSTYQKEVYALPKKPCSQKVKLHHANRSVCQSV